MGSVTYDWSPVTQALGGLGQQLMYRKMLGTMFGQGPQPQPATVAPTGTDAEGNPLSSYGVGAAAARPSTPPGGFGASNYMQQMLPILQMAGPQMGMPLLLSAMQRKMEHDQNIADAQEVPMTAEEKQAAGFRPDAVVYKNSVTGQPVVKQASDMLSQGAVGQKLDMLKQQGQIESQTPLNQYQRAELGAKGAELGLQKQKMLMDAYTNGGAMMGMAPPTGMGIPSVPGGGSAPGQNGLSSYPTATQNMVKAMLEGRQAPPSSFALKTPYWQNMIALANATDPTFDQTQWGARSSARKDFTGGGKSYQTLNAGNTAIQHLGRLYDQIPDVAGHAVPLVGNLVNSAQNAITQSSGIPGLNAYNDTLGHLAEETTKFYRQTGGSEADIERNMKNLSPDLSTGQKQSGVANTVHLIYGKLAPMVEQYNKTMGTSLPPSHFLSQPALATIQKMGFDPDTGEKLATSAAPVSGPPSASRIVGGKTYHLVNGQWMQE